MDGCMDAWNGWMEWEGERMNRRMYVWMEWEGEPLNGRMHGMDGWMDGMGRRTDEWTDAWMHGMDGWNGKPNG